MKCILRWIAVILAGASILAWGMLAYLDLFLP